MKLFKMILVALFLTTNVLVAGVYNINMDEGKGPHYIDLFPEKTQKEYETIIGMICDDSGLIIIGDEYEREYGRESVRENLRGVNCYKHNEPMGVELLEKKGSYLMAGVYVERTGGAYIFFELLIALSLWGFVFSRVYNRYLK